MLLQAMESIFIGFGGDSGVGFTVGDGL